MNRLKLPGEKPLDCYLCGDPLVTEKERADSMCMVCLEIPKAMRLTIESLRSLDGNIAVLASAIDSWWRAIEQSEPPPFPE